jgi:hypothetical protein
MFGPRYRVQTAILWCACFMAMGNIALARELAADLFPGARRHADPGSSPST